MELQFQFLETVNGLDNSNLQIIPRIRQQLGEATTAPGMVMISLSAVALGEPLVGIFLNFPLDGNFQYIFPKNWYCLRSFCCWRCI